MMKTTYVLVNLDIMPLHAACDGFLSIVYSALSSLDLHRPRTRLLRKISRECSQGKGPCISFIASALFLSCFLLDYSPEREP